MWSAVESPLENVMGLVIGSVTGSVSGRGRMGLVWGLLMWSVGHHSVGHGVTLKIHRTTQRKARQGTDLWISTFFHLWRVSSLKSRCSGSRLNDGKG